MLLIVVGCLLLLLVPVGLSFVVSSQRDIRAMRSTETLPGRELDRQRQAAGNTGFSKYCEIAGRVDANVTGTVTSYFSGTDCVWYRYKVIERYRVQRTGANGRRWVEREKTVVEHSAPRSIALRDEHGALIHLELHSTDPDQPEDVDEVFHRSEAYPGPGAPSAFGLHAQKAAPDGRTFEYRYREWVIRPDQRLYVLGEVRERAGSLVIGKPEHKGRFLITTRDEDGLRAARTSERNKHGGCAAAVGVLGLVLIVIGVLTG